jgi:hypothetical protein
MVKEDSTQNKVPATISRKSNSKRNNAMSFIKSSEIASTFKKQIERKSDDYLAPISFKRKNRSKI